MTLAALVVALVLDRWLGYLQSWRRFDGYMGWVVRLERRLTAWPWNGPLGVMLVMVPPVFLVGLIHYVLLGLFWPLALIWDSALLLYSLGPVNLEDSVHALMDRYVRGDAQGVAREASSLLGHPVAGSPEAVLAEVGEGLFAEADRRLFGAVVNFALFGAMGALLYRLAERAAAALGEAREDDMDFKGAVLRLFGIMDWLPARLTALGYALAGHFPRGWEALRRCFHWTVDPRYHAACLRLAGRMALAEEETLPASLSLVDRALWIFLAAVALVTLGSWMG